MECNTTIDRGRSVTSRVTRRPLIFIAHAKPGRLQCALVPPFLPPYLYREPTGAASCEDCMFGLGKREEMPEQSGPSVSTKLCAETFNGKYPHVGLYDCKERK